MDKEGRFYISFPSDIFISAKNLLIGSQIFQNHS